jgi:hypothetical protein
MAEDESLESGYTDYLSNRAVVDLRYVFKLYQHSKIDKLEGTSDASVLDSLGIGEDDMSDFDVKSEQEKAIKTMDRAKALTKGTDFGQEILSKLHEMFYPDDLNIIRSITTNLNEDIYEKIKSFLPGNALVFGISFKLPLVVSLDLPNPMPESTSVNISNIWYK